MGRSGFDVSDVDTMTFNGANVAAQVKRSWKYDGHAGFNGQKWETFENNLYIE